MADPMMMVSPSTLAQTGPLKTRLKAAKPTSSVIRNRFFLAMDFPPLLNIFGDREKLLVYRCTH
jgi:hypothetical protein